MSESSPPPDLEDTIYVPLMRDDLVGLQRMLDAGADPDGPLPQCTPLMEVVDTVGYFGDTQAAITDALLAAGADVHRVDATGRTALHLSLQAGPLAVGRLLAAGADPNHQAFDGSTPLHDLVEYLGLYPDVMLMLLDAGARVDLVDERGRTPIEVAEAEAAVDADDDVARDLAVLRRAAGVEPVRRVEWVESEDGELFGGMIDDVERYLLGFRWCTEVVNLFAGVAIPGVIGVFLAHIRPAAAGVDPWLWVVVGDLPSAYLVVDDAPDSIRALERYVELMADWVATVGAGDPLDGVFPVDAPPTPEDAALLAGRLAFIRDHDYFVELPTRSPRT